MQHGARYGGAMLFGVIGKEQTMRKKYLVDYGKMAVCFAAGGGFVFLSIAMFCASRPLPAWMILFFSLVYFFAAAMNGACVTWDQEGVSEYVLGKRIRFLPWHEVAEVGITGTKVFNLETTTKTGRMYIYFSKEALDDDARFRMMLHWPPRNRIYLLYQADRVDSLRTVCDRPIETYNVGDLEL